MWNNRYGRFKPCPSPVTPGGRRGFAAMAMCCVMGLFNDNFFRQATLLLAVAAGRIWFPGTAMALLALPYLLFSAPAGWLADRFPKRSAVIGAKTSKHQPRRIPSAKWRELIKKVWEAYPLLCPNPLIA